MTIADLKLFRCGPDMVVALDVSTARVFWERETGQALNGKPFEIYLAGYLDERLEQDGVAETITVRQALEEELKAQRPLPFILCSSECS